MPRVNLQDVLYVLFDLRDQRCNALSTSETTDHAKGMLVT